MLNDDELLLPEDDVVEEVEDVEADEPTVTAAPVFRDVEIPDDDLMLNRAIADLVGVNIASERFTPNGKETLRDNGDVWSPATSIKDASYAARHCGYRPDESESPRDICAQLLRLA